MSLWRYRSDDMVGRRLVRAQSLLTPPHSFIPFCIYPIFAASSMQPFKVAFPADISIKPLGDVTSFSIYPPFEMRIFENVKYDFKVRKLHYTSAFSHMMGDCAVLLSNTRYKNRPTEYSIWKQICRTLDALVYV